MALSKTSLYLLGLFILGVVMNVIHLADPVQPGNGPTLLQTAQEIVHGLAEAFVIAAVLGFVVDKTAKEHLMEEFAHDVSAHIIGQYLPDQLRDPIVTMLENRIVRTNWKIGYEVVQIDGNPDSLKLTTTSSYHIKNRSNERQEVSVKYEVEKSLIPNVGEAIIEEVRGSVRGDEQVTGGTLRLDFPDGRDPDPRLNATGDSIVFSGNVVLPAKSEYVVGFRSTEYVRVGSNLPFFTKVLVMPPCELVIDNNATGLRAIVDASFGAVGNGKPVDGKPERTQWSFDTPMLPGQGFTVRFSRTKETASA